MDSTDLVKFIGEKSRDNTEAKPAIFNLALEEDRERLKHLIDEKKVQHVSDDYREELKELFQVRNPSAVWAADFEESFRRHLAGLESKRPFWQEGRWIYYPWSSTLAHILEENEFRMVRSARNRNLITEEEQRKFHDAVIGIAGLSVGNSVALAIALQGGAKRIRLADGDRLALSNLNRIRASVEGLGLNKTVVTARQIYALNPYAEVEIFSEGLNKENISRFFDGPPRLDVVVDEIDNLAVKYLIREEARKHRLAVVMAADNGDNGVVDIERYDLDPATPFFHGRMGEVSYEKLAALDKFGIGKMITKHVGPENVTERMRDSLLEMGKTVVSWPQLGGAALLNGSAAAYALRKIISNQPLEDNRAIISLDEKLIPNYNSPEEKDKRLKAAEEFRKVFGLEESKKNDNVAETPKSKRARRKALIDEIIKDLESLKSKGNPVNLYAVEENIKFYRALQTYTGYFSWLKNEMPKIDRQRLLELSDFHLAGGKWERILQKELLEIGKWKFPDLLRRLRKDILQQVERFTGGKDCFLLVNVGCGAMEMDRQIITELRKRGDRKKIIFLGIDSSEESLIAAEKNLAELKVPLVQKSSLNPEELNRIKNRPGGWQHLIILFKGDVLTLDTYLDEKSADLVYHSKFKHHLSEEAKIVLDEKLTRVAKVVIESDDLDNWFLRVVPLIARSRWHNPVLFSQGVLSSLRDPTKEELKSRSSPGWSLNIHFDGYLRIYRSPQSGGYPQNLPADIAKIIEAGTRAPSGDNCQPWRFKIENGKILLFNIPGHDTSLYSWGQRSSYIAHGALIENMVIAGSRLGYEVNPRIFPEEKEFNLIAEVELKRAAPREEKLYEAIWQRVTNRKPYAPAPLSREEKREIVEASKDILRGKIILAEEREKIDGLAEAASLNEKVLFENKVMHQFFFSHITWSEKEDKEKSIGFYIKTLEIPEKAEKGFRAFSHWPIASILGKLGFANSIARQNAKTYASSAAFAAVIMPSNTKEDYLLAGRLSQRLWLAAAKLGLSVQPLTGIIFLFQRILAGEVNDLSPKHVKIIAEAHRKIRVLLGVENGTVAMLFRLGRSDEPQARSSRLVPEITSDHSLDNI